MGPNKDPKDSGTFKDWRDYSNNDQGMKPSMFEYRDSTPSIISKTSVWPDLTDRHNSSED